MLKKVLPLKKPAKKSGWGGKFEYTAQGMQQWIGGVERKFTTLFNQVCATLNGVKFNAFLCNCLWDKAASHTYQK